MIRFIAPTVAIIATIVAIVVASSRPPTSALTDPIMSVDAVSDTSNTATAIGTIDACRSTTTGATFDVDVVIQDITNIGGFQANLLYSPTVLKVTAVDYSFLLATTGASVLDLGNSTPDTDGDFLLAAAMFSFVSVTGANGDGVLARVTLEAVGSGSSALDITNLKLADADGNPILPTDGNNFYIGPVNDAAIVVDSPCPAHTDSDGDTVLDINDNCPYWPNADQSLPPWPVPPDDPDCDGWNTGDESFIGTDPSLACSTDRWPPDFNSDHNVNVLDIVLMKPNFFSSAAEGPPYDVRFDLRPDTFINVLDINRMKPLFFLSCTP